MQFLDDSILYDHMATVGLMGLAQGIHTRITFACLTGLTASSRTAHWEISVTF